MPFVYTQKFNYQFASKFFWKTLEKRKQRRNCLDDFQPPRTNKQLDYQLEISI